MREETIFTKIINGTIPSKTIYHDDLVTAFLDINPKAEHHILIVTNKPIPSVSQVEPEDEQMMGHLFIVARKNCRRSRCKRVRLPSYRKCW